MPHATHKARRIQHSAPAHVPVVRRSPMRQELMLGGAVGFCVLVIGGLYAASFRYQSAFQAPPDSFPRWTILADDLSVRTAPIKDSFGDIKEALTTYARANRTQAEAAAVMKTKLEAMSASATPETDETP